MWSDFSYVLVFARVSEGGGGQLAGECTAKDQFLGWEKFFGGGSFGD